MIPRTLRQAIAPQCHRCTCRCGVSFQSTHFSMSFHFSTSFQSTHFSTSSTRQAFKHRRAPTTPNPKRGPEPLDAQAARRKRENKQLEEEEPHQLRWLMITDAYSRGQISVTPERSDAFLNDFVGLCSKTKVRTGAVNAKELHELVELHLLTERDLMFLVFLLLRGTEKNKHWGNRLLFSLSAAGFDEASIRIMNHALIRSTHQPTILKSAQVATARGHLQKIARAGKNVRAMVLEGKVAYRLNDQDYAIKLWWQSIDAAVASAKERREKKPTRRLAPYEIPFEETDLSDLSAPWIELIEAHYDRTMVLRTKNEQTELEKAIAIGVEQDDPTAFYYSATYYASDQGYTSHWLYAMTKAAASGVPKAAHELGVYYLESGWKYIDDEPPDHVKPTPFDTHPVGGLASTMQSLSRFVGLSSAAAPQQAEQDSIFHSAAFPSTATDRANLGLYWLNIAKSYLYAPACLYLARFHLQDTLWARATAPKAALALSADRYTYASKEEYAAAVFEGRHTPSEADAEAEVEAGTEAKVTDPPNSFRSDDLARQNLLEVFRARAAVRMRANTFTAAISNTHAHHRARSSMARNAEEWDEGDWSKLPGDAGKVGKFFRFPEVFDMWQADAEGLAREAEDLLEERRMELVDEEGVLMYRPGLRREGVEFSRRMDRLVAWTER